MQCKTIFLHSPASYQSITKKGRYPLFCSIFALFEQLHCRGSCTMLLNSRSNPCTISLPKCSSNDKLYCMVIFQISLWLGAIKTYFKTLKARQKRVSTPARVEGKMMDKQTKSIVTSRRNQRGHNVSGFSVCINNHAILPCRISSYKVL